MARLLALLAFAVSVVARLPSCKSSTSGGFKHPGIYHDCDSLDRIQNNYQGGKPAYSKALENAVSRLPALQPDETWEMDGPYETVAWAGEDGHNQLLMNDGKSAYALTLGWYATGNELWLSRAKQIVLGWAFTLKDLNDHIQGAEGMSYMTAAAEILRASASDSGWTKSNTENYLDMIDRITSLWNETRGLVRPDLFMNQGAYGNSGAMAVAVFSEDRTMYDKMVFHATVGAHPDVTLDYAIPIQISGKRAYHGQVTEMGRDQGHPMGTLRGVSYMGITSRIQGSTDFYTQNSSRLLAGFEYWSRYNAGEDVPWEDRVVRPGSGEVWTVVNDTSRGRNYATYGSQPLEAIGVAFHEYYRRGAIDNMPKYSAYMKWQGVGWDTFEWADDRTLAWLGL